MQSTDVEEGKGLWGRPRKLPNLSQWSLWLISWRMLEGGEVYSAGMFKQSIGDRDRVGICRVIVSARQATYAGGINYLESIFWAP